MYSNSQFLKVILHLYCLLLFSCQVVSESLWPHGLRHTRLLCPPVSPRVCSNSCLWNQSCCLTISSSATVLSFCLQFFPASESFLVSRLFTLNRHSRRRKWQPTPVFLPGESPGRRSLVGYSLWGLEESDTTEQLQFHFYHYSLKPSLLVCIAGKHNFPAISCN